MYMPYIITVIGLPILAVGALLIGAVLLYLRRRRHHRLAYDFTDTDDLHGRYS